MTTAEHLEAAQAVRERKARLAAEKPREQATRGNWTDNPCWYASVQDAGRTALVLGPFETEAECRTWAYRTPEDGGDAVKHDRMVKTACDRDAKAWFYSWGMVKMANGHREGVLNQAMGL